MNLFEIKILQCLFVIIFLFQKFLSTNQEIQTHSPLPVVTIHKESKYWQETVPKRKMFLCIYDPGKFLVCINPQCTNSSCTSWSDPADFGGLGQSALVSFAAATDHMHTLSTQAVKNKAHQFESQGEKSNTVNHETFYKQQGVSLSSYPGSANTQKLVELWFLV